MITIAEYLLTRLEQLGVKVRLSEILRGEDFVYMLTRPAHVWRPRRAQSDLLCKLINRPLWTTTDFIWRISLKTIKRSNGSEAG